MKGGQTSKHLKVTAFPQGELYVPFVRIAGLWLSRFGLEIGDVVQINAESGKITIEKLQTTKKEDS
jgi:hypothetical protein